MSPMLPDEIRVIMIIAPEDFRDEEYFHTRESLEKEGIDVYVASSQKTAISAIDKKEVEVDMLIDEVTDDYSAIVFVGGGGAKAYVGDEKINNLLQSFNEQEKIIAAICIAPLILADANIINDKKVTSWDGVRDDLINSGANYTADEVTVDGNIITADGPKSSYEFGDAIVDALKS